MLCRPDTPPRRGLPYRLAALAWLGAALAPALAQMPGTGSPQLIAAASRWLSDRHPQATGPVTIQPLDPRMQAQACPSGWQFDHPFPGNAAMLRARCVNPSWQVFLQATIPGQTQTQVQGQGPARPQTLAVHTVRPTDTPVLRNVVQTTSLLPRGTRLLPEHLTLVEVPAQGPALQGLERLEDVTGAELVRDIPAGATLRQNDLRPAWMVRKGQVVLMNLSPAPGLQIAARLEALDDGRMGETVRLKNRESGRVVTAVVSGLNVVQGN